MKSQNPFIVAFSAQHLTQFHTLSAGILSLQEKFGIEPVFFAHDPIPEAANTMRKVCQKYDWKFIDGVDPEISRSFYSKNVLYGSFLPGIFLKLRLFLLLLAFGRKLRMGRIFDVLYEGFRHTAIRLTWVWKNISILTPKLLVVPEDGLGANLPLIRACSAQSIPVLIIPYEYSGVEQIWEYFSSIPNADLLYGTKTRFNSWMARFFPRYILEKDGARRLRTTGYDIFLNWLFGFEVLQPWLVHGGIADALAVESPRMLDHYVRSGLPNHKLHLTGSPFDDQIAQLLNRAPTRRPPDALRVLCCIPPDYAGDRKAVGEFSAYWELVKFWVNSVERTWDADKITYQFHPGVPKNLLKLIEFCFKITITQRKAQELIPIHDLLVTSVSSIIRTSIACSVPVINYDVYRFGYQDYENEPGVITVSSKTEFQHSLKVICEPGRYEAVRRYQAEQATKWGMLDGQSSHRISALAKALIDKGGR